MDPRVTSVRTWPPTTTWRRPHPKGYPFDDQTRAGGRALPRRRDTALALRHTDRFPVITLSELLFVDAPEDAKGEDPFISEVDAFLEAQVNAVHFDAITATLGILCDLRTALQLDETNTGLLVLRGVSLLEWSGATGRQRTSWKVVGSTVQPLGTNLELHFALTPAADLRVRGRSAVFHSLDVPAVGEIPDFGSHADREVRSMSPQWDSAAHIIRTTPLTPRPGEVSLFINGKGA